MSKWSADDLVVGRTFEATFFPNALATSKFKLRATHLDGRRAPKVVLSNDDQIVPVADSALLSAKLLKKGSLKIYERFPHGMSTTYADVINGDLHAFIKG